VRWTERAGNSGARLRRSGRVSLSNTFPFLLAMELDLGEGSVCKGRVVIELAGIRGVGSDDDPAGVC
jgi:hypothetical protein